MMMHRIILLVAILFSVGQVAGQSGSARMVNWTFASKKIADDTYEVRFLADINGKFHIYAQDVGVEGPVATTFTFHRNPLLDFNGKVKEVGKVVRKYEDVWGGDVNYFENKVEFVQLIKLKKKIKTTVGGTVEFMVCDDKECLPPAEVPFKISVGG